MFAAICTHCGDAEVVEALRPYLSDARKTRIDQVLRGRMQRVQVAIEEPYDPHNAAAVVRSAEALGAGAVHVIRADERILRQKRTTAGTFHWVDTRDYAELDDFFDQMKAQEMIVAGACVGDGLMLEDLPLDRNICLLFGNENRGLSQAARERCELRYGIPIFGFAESYNLSVSAAVSLYSVLGRMRRAIGALGDLDGVAQERQRARWYLRSVDRRLVKGLFSSALDKGDHQESAT